MKYYIEYELTSTTGHTRKYATTAYSENEAEEFCEGVEKLGGKITLFGYHDSEFGLTD